MYFENQTITEEIFKGTIFEGIKAQTLLTKFKIGEFKTCIAEKEKVVKKVDEMKQMLEAAASKMTGKKFIAARIERYKEDVEIYFEQILLYLNQ